MHLHVLRKWQKCDVKCAWNSHYDIVDAMVKMNVNLLLNSRKIRHYLVVRHFLCRNKIKEDDKGCVYNALYATIFHSNWDIVWHLALPTPRFLPTESLSEKSVAL